MENFSWESDPKVAGRNATKTPLKPPLRISTYRQSPRNRLQSGVASSEGEKTTTESKESAKLNESAKPEPRHHHQHRHFQNFNRQFADEIGLINN